MFGNELPNGVAIATADDKGNNSANGAHRRGQRQVLKEATLLPTTAEKAPDAVPVMFERSKRCGGRLTRRRLRVAVCAYDRIHDVRWD